MELQVSTVPGMRDCFVALPLHAIDALQGRNRDDDIFSVTLELRYPKSSNLSDRFYLSWAGASSLSSSIEVSTKLAECLGLHDGTTLYLRALTDVANATSVEVEPATEDDWEILELNAGFVEDHILSQVGVLSSGQLFPIWVHGDIVLTLHVISAAPKQVVRLVPGTELIVAPKPRKKITPRQDTTIVEPSIVKACLRVQELKSSLLQPCEMENFKCSIAPTTSIFVSANTAKKIPLLNGQLVSVRSLDGASKWKDQYGKHEADKKDARKIDSPAKSVVLRVVYSHLVAKGHVMLSSAIRLFIGAQIHTRIEIRSYNRTPSLMNVGVVLSSISFKGGETSHAKSESLRHVQEDENAAANKTASETLSDWERHKQVLKAVSLQQEESEYVEKGGVLTDGENASVRELFKLWAAAQFGSISECETENSRSIPISKETVMEFLLPKAIQNRNTLKQFPSEADTKNSSEVLYFLMSLQNSEELDKKHEGELPKLVSTSYSSFFMFDQNLLEIEDVRMPKEVPLSFKIGQPQVIPLLSENGFSKGNEGPSLSSLLWLMDSAGDALRRLQISLSCEAQDRYRNLGLPLPGYVLLHGPPASGKTKLALGIASELAESPSILAHIIMVNCSELVGEPVQAIRGALERAISQALRHSPSLIILDDLDMAIPSNSNPDSRELSTTSAVLTEFLADILDAFRDHARSGYGRCVGFLALAQAVSSLPASLCTSGRFDLHVTLPTPATAERAAILLQELENRRLVCQKSILSETALKCDGYDAADLEVLVDRAVHSASTRLLSLTTCNDNESIGQPKENDSINSLQTMERKKFELLKEDFEAALDGFLPVAMRDIAKPSGQVGRLSWEDVGGLNDTCQTLQEMLELPVKFSKIFSNAPLRLRSGVLLYGPPGCGKTHVVAVAAAACSLRLISVKGPELLNKYIGASEQGVRDIFAKAAAAAPCILFFDEFDAIAPKRGHDNTGVTDRVVNQLLTELDGVEALNGVFVFAATSRPDLLDAALLRPGRLDRLLLCDFPSRRERLEILQVLSRKLPLGEDVNLDVVASLTDNLSGADLQAVLSDAQLEAVHSFLLSQKDINDTSETKLERPIITMRVMSSVLLNARPSVSDQERRRLYNIYDMFMSARSSMSDKRRDAKGKRATLA